MIRDSREHCGLGLVYDMEDCSLPSGRSAVAVKMTLTAAGCGWAALSLVMRSKDYWIARVEEANVEIVWDPPWHHAMITEQGKRFWIGLRTF